MTRPNPTPWQYRCGILAVTLPVAAFWWWALVGMRWQIAAAVAVTTLLLVVVWAALTGTQERHDHVGETRLPPPRRRSPGSMS